MFSPDLVLARCAPAIFAPVNGSGRWPTKQKKIKKRPWPDLLVLPFLFNYDHDSSEDLMAMIFLGVQVCGWINDGGRIPGGAVNTLYNDITFSNIILPKHSLKETRFGTKCHCAVCRAWYHHRQCLIVVPGPYTFDSLALRS